MRLATDIRALRQITAANVAEMRLKWTAPLGGARNLRTTPVVVGGIMYATAPNEVYALDARSGRSIWRYARPRTQGVIGDAGAGVNRGVAVRGDRLYMVTDDAKLLALHRGNGQLLWEVTMADYRQHYGATGAPLVVGKLVVSGVSGGDEGIRGFIAAFDAESGKEVWRFWTVPAPGEPGSETWRGKAIAHPCAATWLTGSYDADQPRAVVDDRKPVSRLQRRRAARRQPLVELGRRARSRDRRAALALPVHAARSQRLGRGANGRRRRYAAFADRSGRSCCRPTATGSSMSWIGEAARCSSRSRS